MFAVSWIGIHRFWLDNLSGLTGNLILSSFPFRLRDDLAGNGKHGDQWLMECHPHPPSPRRITRDELLGQLLELATGFSHDMLPKMALGPYTPRLVVILQFSRLNTRIPAEERAVLVEAE